MNARQLKIPHQTRRRVSSLITLVAVSRCTNRSDCAIVLVALRYSELDYAGREYNATHCARCVDTDGSAFLWVFVCARVRQLPSMRRLGDNVGRYQRVITNVWDAFSFVVRMSGV